MINSFKGKYRFLSNFYPFTIKIGSTIYPTLEHAFQSMKTDNMNTKQKIANTKTLKTLLNREIILPSNWKSTRVMLMKYLVRLKFERNKELRKMLLGTLHQGIEVNDYLKDTFWGSNKSNMLGLILMEIRDILREKKFKEEEKENKYISQFLF